MARRPAGPFISNSTTWTASPWWDEETGARFALIAVEGVSASAVAVGRRSSKFAEFTFPFPEGARSVVFDSRWVSMQMAGAAAPMDVAFAIALPPAGL